MKQKGTGIRRAMMILAFYGINFGLWEVLVCFISSEWASFGVYLLLFPITFLLLGKQLKEAWKAFIPSLTSKQFWGELLLALLIYFLLGGFLLFVASCCGLGALTPRNTENVSNQLQAIPTCLTVIQTCVFAPVIEETTFRFSVIGEVEKDNKWMLFLLCTLSVILFDVIHIFTFGEFFYYLAPAIVLTWFYVRRKSVIASMIFHSSLNIIGTLTLLFQ